MLIRALQSNELALHRDVRLRALRESPNAFGQTFDEVNCQPISYWENQTEAVTAPGQNIMFLAGESNDVCGMIYGLRDPQDEYTGRIGGMWVASSHRRQGIGRALLDAVADWAVEHCLRKICLWVSTKNTTAINLYRKAEFSETGETGSLNNFSTVQINEMVRAL
jgi:ribosomal protein S18 acetylase RimI-like enzyme